MSSKASILSNLIVLAAGVVLVLLHGRPDILHWIIFVSGMMFIVPGLINIVMLAGKHEGGAHATPSMRVVGWISSVAAVTLGVIMTITPGSFTSVLVYLFGGVMVLSSLALVYAIASVFKEEKLPGWLYAGPVAVLAAGVVMVCMGPRQLSDSVVTLITGIGMVVFSISWFMTMVIAGNARRRARKVAEGKAADKAAGNVHEPASENDDVKDVPNAN